MKFEIHKKFRFDFDWSQEEYQNAQNLYFAHLKKIDFTKKSSLVKYFGKSFFHDAEVKDIKICYNSGTVVLHLFTANDLDDINTFREAKGLNEISWKLYSKEPILYKCLFKKVSKVFFRGSIDLTQEQSIIDTELDYENNTKDFVARISFSEQDEIEIIFKGSSSIKIENEKLISDYLNGQRKSLPRCETCNNRLLKLDIIKNR